MVFLASTVPVPVTAVIRETRVTELLVTASAILATVVQGVKRVSHCTLAEMQLCGSLFF